MPLHSLVHPSSIRRVVLRTLFAVCHHTLAHRALSLLVMHNNIWVDVSSRNNIGRYLLHLLELLVVTMRHYLLASICSTVTHRQWLPILIELVLLDRLLLVVYIVVVHGRLGVVISITFSVEVVIEWFLGRISRIEFPKHCLINLLNSLTLHWILVLQIWLLSIVLVSKVLYQLVVFLDLFLVILGWL